MSRNRCRALLSVAFLSTSLFGSACASSEAWFSDGGPPIGFDAGVDWAEDSGLDDIDAGGCAAGRLDCNGDPADGCEVDASEPWHCGGCDVVCDVGARCVDGGCAAVTARSLGQWGQRIDSVAFDGDGSFAMAAVRAGAVDRGDWVVERYDATAARSWASHTGSEPGAASYREGVHALAVGAGGVCAGGRLERDYAIGGALVHGDPAGDRGVLACWSNDGEVRWVRSWSDNEASRWPAALAFDDGRLAVAGRAKGADGVSRGWFAQVLDASTGESEREHLYLAGERDFVVPTSIASAEDDLVVTGHFLAELEFGSGRLRSNAAGLEGFVARIPSEESGAPTEAVRRGSSVRPVVVGDRGERYLASVPVEMNGAILERRESAGSTTWSVAIEPTDDAMLMVRAATVRDDALVVLGITRGAVAIDGVRVESDPTLGEVPLTNVVLFALRRTDGRLLWARTWGGPAAERLNERADVITQTALGATEDGVRFFMRIDEPIELDGTTVGVTGAPTWVLVDVAL